MPEQARDLEQQVDLREVVRERADLAADEPSRDRGKRLSEATNVVVGDTGVVDHASGGLHEEAARPGREVEHTERLPLVSLDAEEPVGANEAGTVEHEPNDVSRREELTETVTVDLVHVRDVELAEGVLVEPSERHRAEAVEHLDEHRRVRNEPLVVVRRSEERAIPLGAESHRPSERSSNAVGHLRVDVVEASVVEGLVDELHVLPRAVQQRAGQ